MKKVIGILMTMVMVMTMAAAYAAEPIYNTEDTYVAYEVVRNWCLENGYERNAEYQHIEDEEYIGVGVASVREVMAMFNCTREDVADVEGRFLEEWRENIGITIGYGVIDSITKIGETSDGYNIYQVKGKDEAERKVNIVFMICE